MSEQGYTIVLDCPSGSPRPSDLLPEVLEGTGIEIDPDATAERSFGCWTWNVPNDQIDRYREVRKTIIKERIMSLYTNGSIRYGSW